MVDRLDTLSVVGNAEAAVHAARKPQVTQANSILDSFDLTLGDPDDHPGQSFRIPVCVAKAVTHAKPKSMKKMSSLHQTRHYENVIEPSQSLHEKKRNAGDERHEDLGEGTSQSQSRSKFGEDTSTKHQLSNGMNDTDYEIDEDQPPAEKEDSRTRTFAIETTKTYVYVPELKPIPLKSTPTNWWQQNGEDSDDDEDAASHQESEAVEEEVPEPAALVKAFRLGKTHVPLAGQISEESLKIKQIPGLQIMGFFKTSQVDRWLSRFLHCL